MATASPLGPTCQREEGGEGRMAADSRAVLTLEQGSEGSGSPETSPPAAMKVGRGVGRVDGAWEVMSRP